MGYKQKVSRSLAAQASWRLDHDIICPRYWTWATVCFLLGFVLGVIVSFLSISPFIPIGMVMFSLHHSLMGLYTFYIFIVIMAESTSWVSGESEFIMLVLIKLLGTFAVVVGRGLSRFFIVRETEVIWASTVKSCGLKVVLGCQVGKGWTLSQFILTVNLIRLRNTGEIHEAYLSICV